MKSRTTKNHMKSRTSLTTIMYISFMLKAASDIELISLPDTDRHMGAEYASREH